MKRGDVIKNVNIEQLSVKGCGVGYVQNREVRVWGAFVSECVDIEVIKKRKGVVEGKIIFNHTVSQARIPVREDHSLSCSPWQSITWEEELKFKNELAKNQYKTYVSESFLQSCKLVTNDIQYQYRNKMEFSFCEDETGILSLAFIERGYKTRAFPLSTCLLAREPLMKCAQDILTLLRMHNVSSQVLKSLIVRCNEKGKVIAGLFVKDAFWKFEFNIPHHFIKGFAVYYSNPHSPVSRPDELLYTQGILELDEEICEASLTYGLHSFFQVNIPMIEKTLDDMREFIVEFPYIIDMYCGVGTLGIILSQKTRKHIVFIEEQEESVKYIQRNCTQNEISDYIIIHERSEHSVSGWRDDSCVIIDPPRSGLHKNVIKKLHLEKPKRIVYLSCNIETQARDIQLLKELYDTIWCRAYNFFPRTPHSEGLCILDRKTAA